MKDSNSVQQDESATHMIVIFAETQQILNLHCLSLPREMSGVFITTKQWLHMMAQVTGVILHLLLPHMVATDVLLLLPLKPDVDYDSSQAGACNRQMRCRGFQLQRGHRNNVPTVQAVLERVICQIRQESRETLRMQCSGRTDSGVHAKGQVTLHPRTP